MAYKALYRTYRPNTFDEVVGQKHIIRTLKNAVDQNKIAHAYLFCGPRGTGKTSIAKIFAKAVNCTSGNQHPCMECENCLAITDGTHPDIVEIDAASNNGVEEVRSLIEKVKYAPIKSKYKVYIIDEVHMMSTGAFNALLKTIEEPPAHVIFILATTEPNKVLPTIISRCQRYDFTKVPADEVIKRIHVALDQENIQCEEEVLRIISQLCDGGMRDAWSILDQCIAYAQDDIKVHHINEIYGILTVKEKLRLLDMVFEKDASSCMIWLQELVGKGIDIKRLTMDLINLLKESLIYDFTNSESLLKIMQLDEVHDFVKKASMQHRFLMIDALMDAYDKYRNAASISSYFEICLLRMMDLDQSIGSRSSNNNVEKQNIDNEMLNQQQQVSKYAFHDNRENRKTDIDSDYNVSKLQGGLRNDSASNGVNVSRETIENNNSDLIDEDTNDTLTDNSLSEDFSSMPRIKDDSVKETANDQSLVNRNENNSEITDNTPENRIGETEEIVHSSQPLSNDYVLQLLVGANKPEKQADMNKFQNIHRYTMELQWARMANLLKNGKIFASAESYLVLIVNNQAEANEINESDSRNEFIAFSEELFQKQKKIFAITNDQSVRVTDDFRKRMADGTLPLPITFQAKKSVEKTKEASQEELMIDLFGEENILITED